MRLALLDYGSNSLKCLLVQLSDSGYTPLQDVRIQTRLASALDADNNLNPEAIEKLITATKSIQAAYFADLPPQNIIAVGTQALRLAKNSSILTTLMFQDTGIDLRIISSTEEAELSWKGVISGQANPQSQITMFDSGGASTEFVRGIGADILASYSLPWGAVNLSRQFITSDPAKPAELHLLQSILATQHIPIPPQDTLIGVGGGIVACAKLLLRQEPDSLEQLNGISISRSALDGLITLFTPLTIAQKRLVPGMEPERADTILPAMLLYRSIMDKLLAQSISVSTRGLRHGLAYEYWLTSVR